MQALREYKDEKRPRHGSESQKAEVSNTGFQTIENAITGREGFQMEKKVKRSNRPTVGRVKARRDAARLIINPTIKALISGKYPAHFAMTWLQFFAEFGIEAIVPSSAIAQKRMDMSRYKLTISMLRLQGYGLAEELEEIKNQSWAGRPAKRYRLVIPSL